MTWSAEFWPQSAGLRGRDDHRFVVFLGGERVFLRVQVFARSVIVQAGLSGKRHEERHGLVLLIAFGNVQVVVDVIETLDAEHVVDDEAAVGLRARRE